MTLRVWIDPGRRLVAALGVGTVTDGDVFLYQTTTWARKDIAGFSELVDMSEVDEVQVSAAGRTEDLARIASSMDHWDTASRLAIVAPSDITFELGRMYGTMREQLGGGQKRVGVFRTRPEAERWLGLAEGAIAILFATAPQS